MNVYFQGFTESEGRSKSLKLLRTTFSVNFRIYYGFASVNFRKFVGVYKRVAKNA